MSALPKSVSKPTVMRVHYAIEPHLGLDEFVSVLERSTLGERRPLHDRTRMQRMLDKANLIVTARLDGQLVGVARGLSDFSFCCYLSDLAVDKAFQRRGIGLQLIEECRQAIGPEVQLLLLAAPAASQYYPHIGFRSVDNAWSLDAVTSHSL